jgi:hypothetical protein
MLDVPPFSQYSIAKSTLSMGSMSGHHSLSTPSAQLLPA